MSDEGGNYPIALTARQVLAAPSVTAFVVSSMLMNTGVMLQAAALGKHIFDVTDSELSIGWLGLAEFLPAFLFVLLTGIVADRYNRKKVSLVFISGELACTLALALYAASEPTSGTPIYIVGFFFGTFRAFTNPAWRSIPPMIAPEGGLPRVVAINSAAWTAAAIVGPAVSGFLYAISPTVPYLVSAILIALGIVLLSTINIPDTKMRSTSLERPTMQHAMEGLRFIRRTPALLAAISLDLFAVLFGGAIALLPVIAEEKLGVGAVGYGWLRAASGIGAASMALFLAARPVRRRVGKTLYLAVAMFGFATIVLGTTELYVVAFMAVLVASAADMVSVFIRASIAPLVTPDDKRGRVTAVEAVFIGASNELGAFESGVAANAFGTSATVVGGGIATIAVVGTWWYAFPVLRHIDRFEDLEEGD